MLLVLFLGVSTLLGTSFAANPCLDPTNADYSCELSSAGAINLSSCDITDEDVEDVAACLDDVGRGDITSLNLSDNALTILPQDIFEDLTALTSLDLTGNSLECYPMVMMAEEPTTSGVLSISMDSYSSLDGIRVDTGVTECEIPSSEQGSDSTPTIVGVVSAVAGVALIALAVWLKWRRTANQKITQPPPVPSADETDNVEQSRDQPQDLHSTTSAVFALGYGGSKSPSRHRKTSSHRHTPSETDEIGYGDILQTRTQATTSSAVPGLVKAPKLASAPAPTAAIAGPAQVIPSISEKETTSGKDPGPVLGSGDAPEGSLTATISTANVSTAEQAELGQFCERQSVTSTASVDVDGSVGMVSSASGRRGSRGGIGLGEAVMEAAQNLAYHCQLPGVSEAASVVSTLVKLVSDSRDIKSGGDSNLRQCRSVVRMLERASKVVGRGGEATTAEQHDLIEEVHYAVVDLVELIKTYQSKNKLSKVLMSTSFKRRQDDLEAAIDRALGRLQFGLQVDQFGLQAQVSDDVSAVKEGINVYKRSITEAKSETLAEVRRARRRRKLDQIEIPEDQVWISDELLGKGGFGEVFLAEYNTRNAAAKVLHIIHDIGKRGEHEVLEARTGGQSDPEREKSQRKAFLRELHAMIRLRSPHTVGVYGAITSRPDRLVLVMELLPGGDLRTLLKTSQQRLPEEQSRQIIRDICAGMHFLHGKETVHGDLKSANVLLDGAGRAKIGDFGTSRWSQHTSSTALATYTKAGQNTQMSLAWSAPEVLGASGSTYESDVYSFGIVAWEVVSRELPWANLAHPREVYIRVVLNELRPDIPAGAPVDVANMIRACWAGEPKARPTFSTITERIESNGWSE